MEGSAPFKLPSTFTDSRFNVFHATRWVILRFEGMGFAVQAHVTVPRPGKDDASAYISSFWAGLQRGMGREGEGVT